jgi:1-deoxy-D-xylulose-5-phosphate synthase
MLEACLEAAEILSDEGIEATVWDPRIVKPLDPLMLADAGSYDVVISVEDGFREGGVGTAIRFALDDMESDTDFTVLGVPIEYFAHAKPGVILERLGLDGRGVAISARRAMVNR